MIPGVDINRLFKLLNFQYLFFDKKMYPLIFSSDLYLIWASLGNIENLKEVAISGLKEYFFISISPS